MKAQVRGLRQFQKKLSRLKKAGAKRAMTKATRAGTKVLLAAVRSEIPVATGLLKKSETSKVSGKGLSMTGRVGSDVARLKEATATSKGRRPTNIDWLVEYGHVAPNGKFVPPSGSMRRAAASAMPAAETAYTSRLATEIEREASR